MAKTRAPYLPEFRRQMVDLVGSGRDPDDLACEYEPTAQSIRNWVAGAGGGTGSREEKGLASADAEELTRLRREVRQLRQERDILSTGEEDQRAIQWIARPTNAWFARETGTLPSGSSGS